MWNYCLQKPATEVSSTYNPSLWGGQVGHEDRRIFTAVGQPALLNPWMSKRPDLGLKFKAESNCVRYQCWLLFFTYAHTHTPHTHAQPPMNTWIQSLPSQHHRYPRIMSTHFQCFYAPLHFRSLFGNFQLPESKLHVFS